MGAVHFPLLVDHERMGDIGHWLQGLVTFIAFIGLYIFLLLTYLVIMTRQHRRLIREHSQHGSTRTRAEKIMVLFVESGLLYCLLWASLTVNAFIQVFPVPVDLQPGVRVSTAGNVFLNGGLIQLIGIYPTIVIILACLEIAHCDRDFIYNQTIPAPPEIPLRHITVETQDTMTSREETQERSIRPGRECNLIFAIRLPFHRTYLANVIYLQGIGIVIESRHELALSPVGAHLRTRRW
ncbi:hypothetical protein OF83DRAFT_307893 [Amylostereum chailletii]|nr:hypothetical protein OF83DRAFT_307893 [Amylostereum chailletii]